LVVDRVRGMRGRLQAPCLSRTGRRSRARARQEARAPAASGTIGPTTVALRYTSARSRTPGQGGWRKPAPGRPARVPI
jgi:hypothetical protein